MGAGIQEGGNISIHIADSLQVVLVVKNSPANAGDIKDIGLIPGSGRSLEEGNGNPLPYTWLENSMDRGTWQATVHWVTNSWTQLSDEHTHRTD